MSEELPEADAYDGTEDDLMTAEELARDRAAAGLPPDEISPEQAATVTPGRADFGRTAYEAWNGGAPNAEHSRICWENDPGMRPRWEAAAQAVITAANIPLLMVEVASPLTEADVAELREKFAEAVRTERPRFITCDHSPAELGATMDGSERVAELVTEVNELRARLAAMERDYDDLHAGLERWPRCPDGCGCRLGTDDPERRECGCDGPCGLECRENGYPDAPSYRDLERTPAVVTAGTEHLAEKIRGLAIPDEL